MKTLGGALDSGAVEVAGDISDAGGTWKLKRLDAIAQMDDPKLRENNRYVLRYMAGNSADYDDARFLLTFTSMALLKDAAWQKGKLDGQAEAIRSGYIRDPRTGTQWRLHPVPFDSE
ncbi:hypothetical protein EPK99_20025 [Neorhizobium lilium]|uniref:Uncharacterized protein n=1 Tax=Neorhizobium lilium TaxID=2503024 RepID=A0A3S3S3R2_9HYPH|nr:hypothetical protein [Neorhizobium lilium]RWX75960.1 hypothetical protein EPK99_20025 [Neorhizobium lilium]